MAESDAERKSLLIKVKKVSEKAGLKLHIQKSKIMAPGPITSWQIEGEKVGAVTKLVFLDFKKTAEGDCSHEIKRHLLFGRKAMTSLGSVYKAETCLMTMVLIVNGFSIVMYGCESWTIKKAEHQRIYPLKLWCRRRLLKVPWIARRSNLSILKESVLNIHWKT